MKQFFTLLISCLFAGCSSAAKHTISKIPEASDISYCVDTKTLIVANDEGRFYEITVNGKIISEIYLGKYDLEGVVCEYERFVFAVENGYILTVDRQTLKQNLIRIENMDDISKKHGIEGIAKINDDYYLSIQSKDKDDAILALLTIEGDRATIKDIIHHGIVDSSGMDFKDGLLYIVSDKKDKLYIYDIKNNKILQKIDLPAIAVEGVALDDKGNIFFADDNGAVLKYTLKELTL
jgi:uncharacterized protein YjiK